jgi:hypothetical protein
VLNEGNQIHNFISSSGSGTVIISVLVPRSGSGSTTLITTLVRYLFGKDDLESVKQLLLSCHRLEKGRQLDRLHSWAGLPTAPATSHSAKDLHRSHASKDIGKCSIGDPDPHVFGPPGSGSISHRYGSGSGSFPFPK